MTDPRTRPAYLTQDERERLDRVNVMLKLKGAGRIIFIPSSVPSYCGPFLHLGANGDVKHSGYFTIEAAERAVNEL